MIIYFVTIKVGQYYKWLEYNTYCGDEVLVWLLAN